jgi:DNA-binding CsgD family transcriptional regulator
VTNGAQPQRSTPQRPGQVVRGLRARIERPRDGDDLAALRLELGRALWEQARFAEAAWTLEELVVNRAMPPPIRVAALGMLAGALVLSGRPTDGEAAAVEALASEHADAETRVRARSAIRGLRFFEGRFDDAVDLARAVVRDAADGGAIARGEARLDMGGMLFHADRFAEAETWLLLDADATDAQRDEAAETLAHMNLVRGCWTQVLDAIPASAATDFDASDVSRDVRPALRCHALLHLDRVEEARRELGAHLGPGSKSISIVAAALLAEIDGNLAAAGVLAERAVALAGDLRYRPPLRTWSLELVRLALAAGDEATAGRAATFAEELASMSGVASVQAAATAARGMVERDAARLEDAVEDLARGPRLVATARAAEALGDVQVVSGKPTAAIAAYRRALGIWESSSATLDARRAAHRLRDLGVRTRPLRRTLARTGWVALSPTETTVAALIAEGLTNAQIAARLVISRRTAETHVAHVLSKLDLHTRAGVARQLAERRHGNPVA